MRGTSSTPSSPSPLRVVVLVDQFPELSETFIAEEVRALEGLGHAVWVEARTHAPNPNPAAAGLPACYGVDDGMPRKLADLAWLAARHPLRCVRDVVARRRWRREEPIRPLRSLAPVARRAARGGVRHLHAHFAAFAALDALRLGRLLKIPYSVATHGYDIFREPRNLLEKHASAAFGVTDCEYTLEYLQGVIGPPHADRIHKIVLGVDGQRFRRERPHPGGRTVLAVARLVEKKGLRYLIEAAALLRSSGSLDRLSIVGSGPLHDELAGLVDRLGLAGTVELLGPRSPSEVRDLLEGTDLLAMPCVVAGDGDRDAMPVVVKEALAMEVCVVATAEVGLPEVVGPGWGRLVAPRDSEALAEAIAELLALPPARRAEMGRAGRQRVLETFDLYLESEKLATLIAAAGDPLSALGEQEALDLAYAELHAARRKRR